MSVHGVRSTAAVHQECIVAVPRMPAGQRTVSSWSTFCVRRHAVERIRIRRRSESEFRRVLPQRAAGHGRYSDGSIEHLLLTDGYVILIRMSITDLVIA